MDRRAPFGRIGDHRLTRDLHRDARPSGPGHIKLGTGVVSVSYHNPLWVAERAVLLDHLTRGRFMLGLGPGSLPTDAAMVGLDQQPDEGAARRGGRHHHAPAPRRRAGHLQERPVGSARRPAAPPSLLQSPLRRRRGRGRIARRAAARRQATASGCSRSAPPRRPASTPSRCTGASSRSGRRSFGTAVDRNTLAPGRPDAHRRDQRAGVQGRRVRDRAMVPLLPGRRRLSPDGGRRRQHPGDDRLRQRDRARLDRNGRRRRRRRSTG